MSTVVELSNWLETEFGIVHLESNEHWLSLIAATDLSDDEYNEFWRLYDERAEAVATGANTSELDGEFYELIARDTLSGLVHSVKRCLILDAAALLTSLLSVTGIKGPVLDVGCNVGYHACWIAHRFGIDVVGIDTCRSAIDYANEKAKSLELPCSFRCGDQSILNEDEEFECVYSSDALAQDPGVFSDQIGTLASSLMQGGLLVLFDGDMTNLLESVQFKEVAKRHELGFCLVDITGGFMGTNPDNPFASKQCVAFLKGVLEPIPDDLHGRSTSVWPVFAKYANQSETPNEEKTQAFHRAKVC